MITEKQSDKAGSSHSDNKHIDYILARRPGFNSGLFYFYNIFKIYLSQMEENRNAF